MVQIIKLIVELDNNTAGKHKMHFKNDAFIRGKKLSRPNWPYVKTIHSLNITTGYANLGSKHCNQMLNDFNPAKLKGLEG